MDNRRAIDVHITDDQFAEGDEFIALQLTSLVSFIAIGQQTTVIRIQENDGQLLLVVREKVPGLNDVFLFLLQC